VYRFSFTFWPLPLLPFPFPLALLTSAGLKISTFATAWVRAAIAAARELSISPPLGFVASLIISFGTS